LSRIWLLSFAAASTLLFIVGACVLLQMLHRQKRVHARVQMSRGMAPLDTSSHQGEALRRAWTRSIRALGQFILRTGLLSSRTRSELELTLASAGLRGSNGLELFVGGKIVLLIGLPLVALLALRGVSPPPFLNVVAPGAAGVLGLLLPDFVVRYRRKRYIQRVEEGLPDALDLLVICAQAGLGLSAAIVRVAQEMQQGNADVGRELALTANELQIMTDGRVALLNLGSRTGVEGLVRLATTLVQSVQYGTPLSQSMRVLSAEMRKETLTRFEARAARLGVLLTLPMIIFILPCLFLVVGGPAAVQVMSLGSQ
jgi:tight adherence protein C